MPSEIFRVTQDLGRAETEQVTMRDLNRFTTELNKVLSEIGITFGKVRSQDGATAKYAGDVDLDGHDLLNVNQLQFLSVHKSARGFTVVHNETTERDKPDCHPQYALASAAVSILNLDPFSSADLAALLTDETGTGLVVFNTTPTLVTPTIGSFANATHTHQNAAGGGQLDHGLALTGLADDDHSAYLLASDATSRAAFATNWLDLTDGGATTLHSHADQAHTILDGSVHSDSVAQTVSRGSLIYGNGTPKWDELVVGVTAGMFLRTDATDAMWSTLILPNAITANNIVFGSATNTYGQSTNLTFNGTDFLLGSGIRARMVAQNRFRYLNSIARVLQSASQTGLAVNAANYITFASEDFDTDGLHDNAVTNTRLTFPIVGKWCVIASAYIDFSGVTLPVRFLLEMTKNRDGDVYGSNRVTLTGLNDASLTTSTVVNIAAITDYMEVYSYVQGTSGTYAHTLFSPGNFTNLAAFYVGE